MFLGLVSVVVTPRATISEVILTAIPITCPKFHSTELCTKTDTRLSGQFNEVSESHEQKYPESTRDLNNTIYAVHIRASG